VSVQQIDRPREQARERNRESWMWLTALGIVYGALGTSPLYTLLRRWWVTPESALGVLSLIFWTLIITVSVKYCVFAMRADNHGPAESWRSCPW
jgi:KUP system potassium uptake protein